MDKSIIKGCSRELAIALAIVGISMITKFEEFAVFGLMAYLLYVLVEIVYTISRMKTKRVIWKLLGGALMLVCAYFCFLMTLMIILDNNIIRLSH